MAALAGVPKLVIRQAKKYLEMLEEQSLRRGGQEDLFLNEKNRTREALELLYRLKKL